MFLKPSAVRRLALLALPILFLLAELTLRGHSLPYWSWFNHDPNYAYLFSAMHLLEGVSPVHVDHPGTPVQSLGALVLWLSGVATPAAVIPQSELLLTRINSLLLALDSLGLLFLGAVTLRWSGRLLPSLLAQTAPFLSMLALKHGVGVKPEPMLLLAVLLLSAAMFETLRRPGRFSNAVALGAVIAFGSACKIPFAPLALAPLILLQSRARLVFIASGAVFFALFLFPAYGSLGHFFTWISKIALGTGAYGGGPQTVVDASYPHHFVKLFFARPSFLVIWFGGAGWLLWNRTKGLPLTITGRALLGVLIAQLVQMVLVAKHPSAHYILPALELSGPSAALLWVVSREQGLMVLRPELHRRIFAGLLAALVVVQSVAFIRQDRELRLEQKGVASIDTARDFPGCLRVTVDRASSLVEAWYYNHLTASDRYNDRLAADVKDEVFFVTWDSGLQDWHGTVDGQALIARYSCAVIRSADVASLPGAVAALSPRFHQDDVCQAGSETLLVWGAHCPPAQARLAGSGNSR